jgi:hypothetical protein
MQRREEDLMRAKPRQLTGFLVIVALAYFSTGCGGAISPDAPSASESVVEPDGAGTGAAKAVSAQKIVVNTSIELRVEGVANAYQAITRLVRSAGGYVAESNVSGDSASGSATVRVRVPATMHDEVVAGLRALSTRVVRETTNAKEVTAEYTDLESRLRNLQRNEAQYQTFLGQAKTIDEVLTVNGRLEAVRGQIEETQGRINLLNDLSDDATISVAMSAPMAGGAHLPGPLEVLERALAFSGTLAVVLANVAVLVAVAALWALPVGAACLGGWRVTRRLAPAVRHLLD